MLYKYDTCFYCKRVMNVLDRVGLNIEYRDVRRDPTAYPALRELTGRTQVPCLVIDGKPLLESGDIIAWLEAYAQREG